MALQKELVFYSYDTQPDGLVKPSSILKQMQQIAREDLDQYGLTYQKLREINMIFVLIKINLQILKPIRPADKLILVTNPRLVVGATFIRDFLISDGIEQCAQCVSSWVLIDFAARRPLRPTALPYDIPSSRDNELTLPLEKQFVLDGELLEIGTRKVFYSYLDENRHLNNTVYADIIADHLPQDFYENHRRVAELKINFLNEAYHEDVLQIKRIQNGDHFILSAENVTLQKDCFTSYITIC